MLEKVGFKNFLALRDVELTLEPFTVIVGPNASGKTSILEGIQRISYLENAPTDFFGSELHIASDVQVIEACNVLESRNQTVQPISFSFKNIDNKVIKFVINSSRVNCDLFINNRLTQKSQRSKGFGDFTEFKSNFKTKIIKFSAKLS